MLGLARLSLVVILAGFATLARAATTSFDVLVDTDANAATGCSVATPVGALSGFELRVAVPVTTTTTTGTVGALTVRTCSGGVFGSPTQFDSGGWPVGVGLGTSGSDVIEAYLPLSMLTPASSVRLVLVSSAEVIGPFTVALGGVVAPANVPTLSPLAMAALAIGLGLIALLYLRPGSGVGVVILLLLAGGGIAFAAIAAHDGNPADWSGVPPLGTDPIGDAPAGADLAAFFARVDGANLELRIDARLVFDGANQAPVVNAGPDQAITLPAGATLAGSVTDDGLGNPLGALTRTWSKVSGPGIVTFGDATAASTSATFSQPGVYVLRLTASDGLLQASDDVQITVNPAGGGAAVARVDASPEALLLIGTGASRQLSGVAFDAQSNILNAVVVWTSSDPTAVSVDATGTVRAVIASGSARITATAGGIQSAPVYVTIAAPVAGALLITDSQIVSGPTAVDPAAEPDADNAYEVVLRGVPSMPIGTILINTEALVVGGRVIDVQPQGGDLRVRLVVVPPQELFTDFSFQDTVDLTRVPFETPADIAALYDVVQTGTTFVFTPKPAAKAVVSHGALGGTVEGTRALPPLPPFSECKADLGFGSGLPIPLSLSASPAFTVNVNGQLINEFTPQGKRVVVKGTPTFTLNTELEIRSAFEAKIECRATLQRRKVRVPGWAGLFFGGDVEFGVGFEVAGKVTLASAKVGGSATLNTTIEAGIVCPAAASCAIAGDATATTQLTPKFETPSLDQLKFEPSVNLFAFVAGELGNADIEQLQFKAIEAKAGAKLAASYTLEALQIDNVDTTDGLSKYSLRIEGEVGPGIKLGEFLEYVGIADFVPLKLTFMLPLGESPTGSVSVDRATYLTGDRVNMRVRLNPASTMFLLGTFYNVDRVVAVRKNGAFSTQALATQSATNGQTDFTLAFDSPAFLTASELFAFVVPRFLPLDPPKLEVGSAVVASVTVVVTPSTATLTPGQTQQFTATVSGTTNTAVTWTATGGTVSATGLYTAGSSAGSFGVTATSVADPTKSESATVTVTAASVILLTDRLSDVEVRSGTTPEGSIQDRRFTSNFGAFSAGPLTVSSSLASATADQTSSVTLNAGGSLVIQMSGSARGNAESDSSRDSVAQGDSDTMVEFEVVGNPVSFTISGQIRRQLSSSGSVQGRAAVEVALGPIFRFIEDCNNQACPEATTPIQLSGVVPPGFYRFVGAVEAKSQAVRALPSVVEARASATFTLTLSP